MGDGVNRNTALFTKPIAVSRTLAGSIVGSGYSHTYESMIPEPLDDDGAVDGKFTEYKLVWNETEQYPTLSTFIQYANTEPYQIAHRIMTLCKS